MDVGVATIDESLTIMDTKVNEDDDVDVVATCLACSWWWVWGSNIETLF